MLALLDQLAPACREHNARLGLAPHSLRAVTPESLHDALAGLEALDPNAPIHIHIAEQQREVQDCLAWSSQRPVEWLLNNAAVDTRWCLVHATHMNEHEAQRLAASGAVAGICATTEANLGDGVFDAPRYLEAGGAWGIGSDSHASVSVTEDLRLFEYSQRLTLQRRNVLASASHPQVAERLYLDAVAGGARASGRAIAGLAVGQQTDLVVLDGSHPAIAGLSATNSLSAHVFAHHGRDPIAQVWSAGRCRVEQGRHSLAARAAQDFVEARRALLDAH
jgi:formimidoylglutamate deiminase